MINRVVANHIEERTVGQQPEEDRTLGVAAVETRCGAIERLVADCESPTASGRALVLASPRPRSSTVCLNPCKMGILTSVGALPKAEGQNPALGRQEGLVRAGNVAGSSTKYVQRSTTPSKRRGANAPRIQRCSGRRDRMQLCITDADQVSHRCRSRTTYYVNTYYIWLSLLAPSSSPHPAYVRRARNASTVHFREQ